MLANGQPVNTLMTRTSNPIAEFRSQLNTADWMLAQSTVYNANPWSQTKLGLTLATQERGLVPNLLIIPHVNTDNNNKQTLFYAYNRSNFQVSLGG